MQPVRHIIILEKHLIICKQTAVDSTP